MAKGKHRQNKTKQTKKSIRNIFKCSYKNLSQHFFFFTKTICNVSKVLWSTCHTCYFPSCQISWKSPTDVRKPEGLVVARQAGRWFTVFEREREREFWNLEALWLSTPIMSIEWLCQWLSKSTAPPSVAVPMTQQVYSITPLCGCANDSANLEHLHNVHTVIDSDPLPLRLSVAAVCLWVPSPPPGTLYKMCVWASAH